MRNFYTLLKRVSASSLIGVVVMLLMVACPEPEASGGGTSASAIPPKSPTLNSVTRLENEGGVKVDFIESSSADVEYTLITATSIPGPEHTGPEHVVKLKVLSGSVRGSVKSVKLLGLKSNQEYNITIAAVTKVGVESTPQPELAKKATTDEDNIRPRVSDIIGFVIIYKLDVDTTKVTWNTPPALVGIDRIEVIATSGNLAEVGVYEKAVKSDPIKVDPNDIQEVLLDGLESEKVAAKEINIFYQLYDINENSSRWIKVGSTAALGAVIDPVATEKGKALTIAATPPTDVDEERIKYTLYYAKIGDGGVLAYADTEAIKTKVDEDGVAAAVAGKVEITGNAALAKGFMVEGISEDTIYRYFIRSIHPDDDTQYTDTSEALAFVLKPKRNIVIPNTKTIIDTNEFFNKNLTSVFIPDSVTSIGGGAFRGNKLMTVTIPDSVMSIGVRAFNQNELTSVKIPTSVTSIGEAAFMGNKLMTVTIPDSVTSISKQAFMENKLKSVTIPDSVMSIGVQAFNQNELASVKIPTSVTSIGNYAFMQNKLKSVTIPDLVTNIGKSAFIMNPLATVTLSKELHDKIKDQSEGLSGVFGSKVTTYTDYEGNPFDSEKKEIVKPKAVTAPSVTKNGEVLTVTATPPADVDEKRIKYALYYAKIGDDGVSGYADTEAIRNKVDEEGVVATVSGKVELTGNTTLKAGFTVEGISKDTIYRYFIRSIHPDDEKQYSDTSDLLAFVLYQNADSVVKEAGKVEIVSAEKPEGTPRTTIDANEYKWTKGDKITHVVIPDTVTSIGKKAFYKNKLQVVKIPNKVTSIGHTAFAYNKLTDVVIPNKVTSIGVGAFYKNKLTSVTIGNSVTSIGESVFRDNQLMSVVIPNSVTSIGKKAFQGNKLTDMTIPNSVTSIGESAFQNNELTSVAIPNSVTIIDKQAFWYNKLTDVTIPDSVTIIGKYTFANNELESVTIPNSVTSIDNFAFANNELKSVTIPNSVTSIGNSAFAGLYITTVTLSKELHDKIKNQRGGLSGVFGGKDITYQHPKEHVKKPEAVTVPSATEKGEALTVTATPADVDEKRIKYALYYAKIGDDGVSGYANTEAIKTKAEESSVKAAIAGKKEIQGNPALATGFTVEGISKDTIYRYFIRSIHPDDEEQYSDTSDLLAFVLYQNADNVVKSGKVEIVSAEKPKGTPRTTIGANEYEWTKGDKITHVIIPDSVTSIGKGAFYLNKIKTLTIPASITDLGTYAFANNQLEKVEILASLITIKKGVFNNNKIKELTLPDSITDIGMQSFENNKIEEIILPSKLKTIGNKAFFRNKIKALKMPNTVKTIGDSAFENNEIQDITLSSSLTSIGNNAFKKNKILVLEMPNSVTTMGEQAFRENAITTLTLSNSLTTISHAAFFKNEITAVALPAGITIVEVEAFTDNKITSLTVSEAVTYIKRRAFMENEIENLTLSEGLVSLGNGAFQNNKITQVKIPKSVTRVGSHAFYLNKDLTRVTLLKSLFDSFKSQKALGDVFIKGARYFDYEGKSLTLTKVVLLNKEKPLEKKLEIKETKRKALLDKKKDLEGKIKELQPFLMLRIKRVQEDYNKQTSELEKVKKQLQDLDKLNSERKEVVKPSR